ncbi:MAG TPA: glycine cleavage system aminomethyltransferase GcvT [Candidatus Methylomirabilis sp.]|nr:glycine cleavage system aminomethyltransferase GcvT [Candidatus Methylomirabilis sp.]
MDQNLKRTPFYDLHVAAGAKIVPFAGYEMPVQYPEGITAETNTVRRGAGLFDVSHMGEFEVTGRDALAFVSYVTSNDPGALAYGQVQYSCFMHETGGIVDDCLVYRLADRMMLVVNASNTAKDWAHINRYASKFDVKLANVSDEVALLALQGPRAQAILQPLAPGVNLDAIKYYHCVTGKVAGVSCIISRTGYTGEDGFELYHGNRHAAALWRALVRPGGEVKPVGLGARDTLRLEMAYPLYGNDIDDETTPLEAGLGWIVKLKKGDCVGKGALEAQKARGLGRKLVGFVLKERGFPRHHYPVWVDGQPSGEVRSGIVSPSTGDAIGTAYLPFAVAKPGTRFEVEIRGARIPAEVVETPFWKKGSHR